MAEEDKVNKPADAPADGEEELKGIDLLLNNKNAKYERLPMLEVVFDRLTRYMTKSLRSLTYENVEISPAKIDSMRFGNVFIDTTQPSVIVVIKAEEWGGMMLMRIDSHLVQYFIDVLLGGHRIGMRKEQISAEKRFSNLEFKIIERIVEVIFADLTTAFDPITYVNFTFERIETNFKFASITRESSSIIKISMNMDINGVGGSLDFAIPYSTIEPVREILLQMFFGEKLGKDNIWEMHLVTELLETYTEIEAVLHDFTLPLGNVLNWKVGDTIELNLAEDPDVEIRAGGIGLFTGKIGRIINKISVQVHDSISNG